MELDGTDVFLQESVSVTQAVTGLCLHHLVLQLVGELQGLPVRVQDLHSRQVIIHHSQYLLCCLFFTYIIRHEK